MNVYAGDNRRTIDSRNLDRDQRLSFQSPRVEDDQRLVPASNGRPSGTRPVSLPIRVVVIDDQGIVRQGVRVFVEADAGIVIVGEADGGETGLAMVRALKPDVAVVDVMMPQMDGIAATAAIRRESPSTQVIALSSTMEPRQVAGMIRAGAMGYLPKDVRASELCKAIHAVAASQVFLTLAAATCLTKEMREPVMVSLLTARETEVLQLLVGGKSNKEMGHSLHITEKTVKTHMSNIISKLGVQSRTQAALIALQRGLVEGGDMELAS